MRVPLSESQVLSTPPLIQALGGFPGHLHFSPRTLRLRDANTIPKDTQWEGWGQGQNSGCPLLSLCDT